VRFESKVGEVDVLADRDGNWYKPLVTDRVLPAPHDDQVVVQEALLGAVDLADDATAWWFARGTHEATHEDVVARLEALHAEIMPSEGPLIPHRRAVTVPAPRLEMRDHPLRPNSEYLARRDCSERSGARFLLDDVEMTRSVPVEG
jgi:hypothetical protein